MFDVLKKITRGLKKILLTFFLLYIAMVAMMYVMQRNMIFYPPNAIPNAAQYSHLGVQEIKITSKNSLALKLWHIPSKDKEETFVFFHGNASSHDGNLYIAQHYIKEGYGFLSVGYPGYGGNEGKPSEQSLYDAARSTISYAKNELGLNEDSIVLYGQSIGSGVAVQMAKEFQSVRAVILESPYTSMPDVAADRYFFVPVRLLMKDRFDSLSKVNDVKTPVFILQGLKDRIISPQQGKTLYEALSVQKDMISFENAGHNDMPIDSMAEKVIQFISAQSPQE